MTSRGACLAALVACLAGAPAHAECPASGVQDAVGIYLALQQPGTDPAAAAAAADALASSCASSPHVQRVAAMTYQALTGRAGDVASAYDSAVKAWKYFEAMRRVRGSDEKPVMVMANGQPGEVDVFASDGLEEALLTNVFIVEMRTGRILPEHAPVRAGETPRACGAWDPIDAQHASWFVRKNLKADTHPALDLLDRVSLACAGELDKSVNSRIPALRAAALTKLLEDNPKRPDALAMLDKALADSRRFFELRPKGDLVYWSPRERDELEQLAGEVRFANAALPPEEDWFKPGNPESSVVVRAIAAKLDDAWAVDAPLGTAGAYKTYRGVMAELYARALKSGNHGPAKHALALAARGHADGTMRRAETKELKPPPDFLWNWVEPATAPGH